MNKKLIYNIITIIILLCGTIWVCSHFVHLGRVEYTDNAQIRRNIIPINARLQAYIKEIRFSDFDKVRKGDTLVIFENAEYLLKLEQAKAHHEKAVMDDATLSAAISTTSSNIDVSKAAIEESRVRMEQKKIDFERYNQLLAQKSVTQQQYDNVKADYQAAKAKYEMMLCQNQSTILVQQEQTQKLVQNRSNKSSAKASQELADLNLSYTVVRSPCDGVTSSKGIEVGQLIQPGQKLLSIVESETVWVIANYKEKQTANISVGMPVKIKVDAIPDVVYHGVVACISNATGAQYSAIPQDNSAGNFVKVQQRIPIKISFSDKNKSEDLQRLCSGMNVECEIEY